MSILLVIALLNAMYSLNMPVIMSVLFSQTASLLDSESCLVVCEISSLSLSRILLHFVSLHLHAGSGFRVRNGLSDKW